MNKAKQDFFRKMNHVNHQLPQIVVKKHPVKRRKIEIGKSADNKKQRLIQNNRFQKVLSHSLEPSKPTEEAIKLSSAYQMLEKEIINLQSRCESEISKLKQEKLQKEEEIEKSKKDIYGTKLDIWELKNQKLELLESIREEKQEGERLQQELLRDERFMENSLQESLSISRSRSQTDPIHEDPENTSGEKGDSADKRRDSSEQM